MDGPYQLIDGDAMARENPRTWTQPSPQELRGPRPGDFVKVGARFNPAKKRGEDAPALAVWQAKVGDKADSS